MFGIKVQLTPQRKAVRRKSMHAEASHYTCLKLQCIFLRILYESNGTVGCHCYVSARLHLYVAHAQRREVLCKFDRERETEKHLWKQHSTHNYHFLFVFI